MATAWLKNSTGETLLKGNVVKASAAADDSIILTPAGDTEALGIVVRDIAAGLYGEIKIAGLAEVLVDSGHTDRGDIISVSLTVPGWCSAENVPGSMIIGAAVRASNAPGLVWTEVRMSVNKGLPDHIYLADAQSTAQLVPGILVGGIAFDPTVSPGVVALFRAIGAVDDAANTGTVQLYDLTHMAELAHLDFTAVAPAVATSAALVLAAHECILEVRLWTDAGMVSLTSAWLEVSR